MQWNIIWQNNELLIHATNMDEPLTLRCIKGPITQSHTLYYSLSVKSPE